MDLYSHAEHPEDGYIDSGYGKQQLNIAQKLQQISQKFVAIFFEKKLKILAKPKIIVYTSNCCDIDSVEA